MRSGSTCQAVVAEYRALRASVIRLWRETHPVPDQRDLDDLTRFNESIDQSLTEAVSSYTQRVDQSRQMFLAILGHDLRNPLNSIVDVGAGLLSQTAEPDAASSEMASQISTSAAAMARMISDLLDFTAAGLGGGDAALKPARDGPRGLCQEVVDELHAASPKHLFALPTAWRPHRRMGRRPPSSGGLQPPRQRDPARDRDRPGRFRRSAPRAAR